VTSNTEDHTIYVVHGDVENYQSLVLSLTDAEYRRVPELTGRPVQDTWIPPPVESEDLALPKPDVWRVSTPPKTFAMSPTVVERLEPFISMAGELLPLCFAQEELFALNLLEPIEVGAVLDLAANAAERRAEVERVADSLPSADYRALVEALEAGDPWPVLQPVFREENLALEPTFFKIDRLPASWFLNDPPGEDTLLPRIEALGITGLMLQKVWSRATGPEPINLLRR
jgi:hypothetical protein